MSISNIADNPANRTTRWLLSAVLPGVLLLAACATPLKPGSATRPFFGVQPAIVDGDGHLDALILVPYAPPALLLASQKDSELAFERASGDVSTLVTVDRTGRFEPAWSPDGKKLALYLQLPETFSHQIWLLTFAGDR